jgi:hypothetical protein
MNSRTKKIARFLVFAVGLETVHFGHTQAALSPQPHTEVELVLPPPSTASRRSLSSGAPTRVPQNPESFGIVILFMLAIGLAAFLLGVFSH